MVDQQEPTSAKPAWDAESARKFGDELGRAVESMGAAFKAWGADTKRNSEVAALAGLYRQVRKLDAHGGLDGVTSDEVRHARQDELRGQMAAAVKGYDVKFLAELATFGGWLADAAGKEWRSRV